PLRALPSLPTRRSSDLRSFAARRMKPLAVSLAPNVLRRNAPHGVGLAALPFRFALNHLVPTRFFTSPGKLAFVRFIFAPVGESRDRKSTRLNSSHVAIS